MYFNTETGEVLNTVQLRNRYPNISFPALSTPKDNPTTEVLPRISGVGSKSHLEVPVNYFTPPSPWVPYIPDEPLPPVEPGPPEVVIDEDHAPYPHV